MRSRTEMGGHRTHIAMTTALFLALSIVLAAGLAACGASAELPASPSPAPTAVLSPTYTVAWSRTPTVAPTRTPTAVPSPTNTLAPLPTETPEPSPARPFPTLLAQPTPDGTERTARVPILMYHRITDPPEDATESQRDYMIPPSLFEEQLRYLSDNGYQSISLYDLNSYLQSGHPLPDRAVVLTFDDGYRDNAVVAFPLLLKYGFTATFFINTQPIEDEYPAYMTWVQVEQMSQQGMDIESHSATHPRLKELTVEDVAREVRDSKEAIQKHTGKTVRFFSYPYGHYDQRVVDILQSEGFWGAVTLNAGVSHESMAMFDLNRVWMRADETLESFAVKLQRGW